jgi:hypothetical protein
MQTRCGGDLLEIATGRFREAAESTVIDHTAGGALGKLPNAHSAYEYTATVWTKAT